MEKGTTMKETISEKVQKQIADAYRRGDKLRDISEAFGVPRATVYYCLEKQGVTSDRVKRGSRLTGGDQELAQLYELIEAQQKVIEQQAAEIKRLKAGR